MYQRKPRRFRHHSNDRRHQSRSNGDMQMRMGSNTFANGQTRNNFRNTLSVEKLFEKYSALSKEAMSSGDKISSENYLQHAEHFMRVIKDKNKNYTENKSKVITTPVSKDKPSSNNIVTEQNKTIKDQE
tara:strand:- start:10 stop:396 length:387 start_codon:yes stop_codon:yes gene_type:complete